MILRDFSCSHSAFRRMSRSLMLLFHAAALRTMPEVWRLLMNVAGVTPAFAGRSWMHACSYSLAARSRSECSPPLAARSRLGSPVLPKCGGVRRSFFPLVAVAGRVGGAGCGEGARRREPERGSGERPAGRRGEHYGMHDAGRLRK